MVLNIDGTLERKLACAFKNGMRNLTNFHQCTFESLKIGTLMRSFYPKQKMYGLKIYGGVFVMIMKDYEELRVMFDGTEY